LYQTDTVIKSMDMRNQYEFAHIASPRTAAAAIALNGRDHQPGDHLTK
jgi:hypothetical protein